MTFPTCLTLKMALYNAYNSDCGWNVGGFSSLCIQVGVIHVDMEGLVYLPVVSEANILRSY